MAHDVAVAGVAEQLERQQGSHGVPGRDHLRARQAGPADQRIEADARQPGQEEKQAAEPRAKATGRQVEFADIGHRRHRGPGPGRPFVVASSGQSGEALLPQMDADHGRADAVALLGQGLGDVVDGEVLLAEGDDRLAQFAFRGAGSRLSRG